MSIIEKYKNEFMDYFSTHMNTYFDVSIVLDEACLYSLFAGGKRIRPVLTMLIAHLNNGDMKQAMHFGCATEMIHTYSLIHDDLPAMDNDDFRRGKPTCHKRFSEGIAILAGDTLLNEAPLFIGEYPEIVPKIQNTAIKELLNASGRVGMIKGQILDVINENKDHSHLNQEEQLILIKDIHNHKTGKLFSLSCILGALCSPDFFEMEESVIDSYREFGLELGLLFQVRDDIIDNTQSFEQLGKTPGKDLETSKLTYVSILGLNGAIEMANDIHNNCFLRIQKLGTEKSSIGIVELLGMLKKDIY